MNKKERGFNPALLIIDICMQKQKRIAYAIRFVLALPIFPGRRQPSIVGRDELNYRVRNGNGWTLILINTNSVFRVTGERLNYKDCRLSCQERFVVTRTGFEPMLTA